MKKAKRLHYLVWVDWDTHDAHSEWIISTDYRPELGNIVDWDYF